MIRRLRFVKRLVHDLPAQMRLAYCLMRDPEVPLYTKAVLGGALGLIMSPSVNIPETIPVIGELDVLALTLIALKLFIAACPDDAVAEQEQLLIEQRSRFDEDVRSAEKLALALARRFRRDSRNSAPAEVVAHPSFPGAISENVREVSA